LRNEVGSDPHGQFTAHFYIDTGLSLGSGS
jgi:hypothetical protein